MSRLPFASSSTLADVEGALAELDIRVVMSLGAYHNRRGFTATAIHDATGARVTAHSDRVHLALNQAIAALELLARSKTS